MVKLIKSDVIKINILKQYEKRNISYTASLLSDILKCKFQTVRNALEFFYCIGIVDKEIKEHGDKNYTYYNLTEIGKKILELLKNFPSFGQYQG